MKIYESLCCDYAITTQDTTLEKNYRKYSDLSKVFGNVKNPYIINQNHIFSKNYYEVISG
jgi:hypothetical protein